MIAPVLLIVALALQPPDPSRGNNKSQPQSQQSNPSQRQPAPVERGTDANPLIIRAQQSDLQAAEDKEDRNDQRAYRRYTLLLSAFTLVVVGFQVRLIVQQNKILRRQGDIMEGQRAAALKQSDIMNRQHSTAVKQAEHMEEGLKLTRDALSVSETAAEIARQNVVATLHSAEVAITSVDIANSALKTNCEIERAYIALSHRDILFLNSKCITPHRPDRDDADPDCIDFIMLLKNYGRTPGEIVGGWCGYVFQRAADGPDFRRVGAMTGGRGHLPPAFLLPNPDGFVDFAATIELTKESVAELRTRAPGSDDHALWVVGEVDYRDRFGTMHRGGYARIFSKDAHNFVIDPSVGALNYDRPLTDAEIVERRYQSQPSKKEGQP